MSLNCYHKQCCQYVSCILSFSAWYWLQSRICDWGPDKVEQFWTRVTVNYYIQFLTIHLCDVHYAWPIKLTYSHFIYADWSLPDKKHNLSHRSMYHNVFTPCLDVYDLLPEMSSDITNVNTEFSSRLWDFWIWQNVLEEPVTSVFGVKCDENTFLPNADTYQTTKIS